jgi:hypothetical protein
MKYYFETQDSEKCYTIDYFYEQLSDDLPEMTIYPAKIMYGSDYFYCQEYGEMGEKGEGCGRFCDFYKPRNGKNGRCRHSRNPYEPAEKPITIKK